MNWETGVGIYGLRCIKQGTNEAYCIASQNPAQCSDLKPTEPKKMRVGNMHSADSRDQHNTVKQQYSNKKINLKQNTSSVVLNHLRKLSSAKAEKFLSFPDWQEGLTKVRRREEVAAITLVALLVATQQKRQEHGHPFGGSSRFLHFLDSREHHAYCFLLPQPSQTSCDLIPLVKFSLHLKT